MSTTTTYATLETVNTLMSRNVNLKILSDIEDVSDPNFNVKIEIDEKYENLIEFFDGYTIIANNVADWAFQAWEKDNECDLETKKFEELF